MGIRLVTVPFGRPAADRLAALVDEAKAGAPLAPATVVVADNVAGVAARRSLAARRGIVAVTFVTLHRLAELLAAASLAAAGRRPVSPPIVVGAVRAVLADEPGLFAPVASHPATEEALGRAYRELAGVSADGLAALAATSARASDVVRVCTAARTRLSGRWFDEADLLAEAAAVVGDEGAAAGLGPVIVHLPRDVPGPAVSLLAALGRRTEVTVVVGVTGDRRSDARVADLARELGVAAERTRAHPATAARVRSVSDPDDEVRHAVRDVLEAMHRGVAIGRTAILFGPRDPYAGLVHEQLAAAGLPRSGAAIRSIGDGLLGRTLRGLLALPDHGYRRRDVLGLLACNEIVDGEGRPVAARAWERVSRAAGVVDGDDWSVRLAAFATASRDAADAREEDGQVGRARAQRADADRALALRAFIERLRRDLEGSGSARTWSDLVVWSHGLLATYLGDESRRAGWPADEQHSATRVEEALDRLAGLDQLGGPPPSFETFRRSLDAELAASARRSGRLGEGVYVGSVASAEGLEFDAVTVLGLAEGVFPARRLDDPLLPDREREATEGEVPTRSGRVDDEFRALSSVLAGARVAVLSFPRGDLRRTGERTASRWLLDVVRRRAGSEAPLFTSDLAGLASEPWFEHVPSHIAAMAAAHHPATVTEFDVGALTRDRSVGQATRSHPLVAADAAAAAGVELALARAGGRFTRFDGNLGGLSIPAPTDDGVVVSPTRLEAWASCPHRYLFEHLLGVAITDDPERIVEMTPIDRGNLVHDALERFVVDALGAPAREPWSWTGTDRDRMQAIADELCATFEEQGVTGKAVFWRHDRARIVADLLRFVDEDSARLAAAAGGAGARPVAAEHAFGFGAAVAPPVVVDVGDGRSVRFGGKIDRIDAAADGSLVVVDYKTGGTSSVAELTPEDPVVRGTKLQLPVYAAAARSAFGEPGARVHAAYWFVTTDKGRWKSVGYDITDDVGKRFTETVALVADGIAGGVFPSRPPAVPSYGYVDCRFCDPDGLGAGDRRREWERKRNDAALRAYATLAEPDGGSR